MPTPSKASFGGSRKDQNAAHSRVYRLLKKQRTESLAEEVVVLNAEVEALMAAHALSGFAQLEGAAAITRRCSAINEMGSDEQLPLDEQSPAADERTRKEKKALAAKAARTRARERLATLESQVASLRQCIRELNALSRVPPVGRMPPSSDGDCSEDSRSSSTATCDPCEAESSVPPKKRHRSKSLAVIIEDVD